MNRDDLEDHKFHVQDEVATQIATMSKDPFGLEKVKTALDKLEAEKKALEQERTASEAMEIPQHGRVLGSQSRLFATSGQNEE